MKGRAGLSPNEPRAPSTQEQTKGTTMNNPNEQAINIDEERKWLIEHRSQTQASWSDMAKRLNIPTGTLSQFGSERGYAGDEQRIAGEVFKYRQMLAAQAAINVDAPDVPGYFETPTSTRITQLLSFAQRGRIIVAALGPGMGKTMTIREFRACFPNVFVTTISPSTAGVNNMQIEVLEALGERNPVGTPQKLSRQIRDRVEHMRNPLIVLDEAQHLSEKSIEEIRSWHDAVGVGIALVGNESVLQRLEGGSRRAAFAQLFSRVALRMVRAVPVAGDVDAMADAWNIQDAGMREYLRKIGMMPGGLRGATMVLELASMMAAGDRQPLDRDYIHDAWTQLSARAVMA